MTGQQMIITHAVASTLCSASSVSDQPGKALSACLPNIASSEARAARSLDQQGYH